MLINFIRNTCAWNFPCHLVILMKRYILPRGNFCVKLIFDNRWDAQIGCSSFIASRWVPIIFSKFFPIRILLAYRCVISLVAHRSPPQILIFPLRSSWSWSILLVAHFLCALALPSTSSLGLSRRGFLLGAPLRLFARQFDSSRAVARHFSTLRVTSFRVASLVAPRSLYPFPISRSRFVVSLTLMSPMIYDICVAYWSGYHGWENLSCITVIY